MNYLRKISICLFSLACLAAAAQEEKPIIDIKTNSYAHNGESNVVTVLISGIEADYIDVDCGFGLQEYTLEARGFNEESGSLTGTYISCNVSKDGYIKIYGNAANIDMLNIDGCYVTDIEMSSLVNLEVFNCEHNELNALDLSNNKKIVMLYMDDNPFTVSAPIIGEKPDLVLLEMGKTDKVDPDFNLSNYPKMVSFSAYANSGLTSVDPTGCPELQRLSIDVTPVSSIDVSKNQKLTILNVSDTKITSLDLKNNTSLMQLFCSHSASGYSDYKIKELDLSNNVLLTYLFASDNDISSIDVTGLTYLQDLVLRNNRLSSIDVSQNTNLNRLFLNGNYFDFTTLPLPGEWNEYEYDQHPLSVAKSHKVGTTIDLSDRIIREGTNTLAALFKTSESNPGIYTELAAGTYYTYENGKITFLKEVSDSVYLAFYNDAFPNTEFSFKPLTTNRFMVKSEAKYGQDDLAFSFTAPLLNNAEVSLTIGMDGASAKNPKTVYVDFGDGTKTPFSITSQEAEESGKCTGVTARGMIKVYVPEGETITALDMEGFYISAIDLTALKSLRTLRLVNTELYSIDLTWNRCLQKLELTGNHLSKLNIRGANDAYQKNVLTDINLSSNEMTEVTLNDMLTIHHLNLSNNNLTELSFKDGDNLETLNVSGNQLTSVNISYSTQLGYLNISNNMISSLVMPETYNLEYFNCSNNAFTFLNLPSSTNVLHYIYTPQNDITIATKCPSVDLSEQNIEGKTTYVWKQSNGTEIVKGTDYTEDGGKTLFLQPVWGKKVYCEMENTLFPGLTLKTTTTEAADKPEYVFATFTTTSNVESEIVLSGTGFNTTVYIDWKGDGIDLQQYILPYSYSSYAFPVKTYAGAEVKLYSYSNPSNLDVFSLSNVPMSSFDGSKLSQVTCINITGAGLSEITLPEEKSKLTELMLDFNNLTSANFSEYPLYLLSLNNNKIENFDASLYTNLGLLSLSSNGLKSIKLDNSQLWSLDLANNDLTSVDLTKLPDLQQVTLSENYLSNLDVTKNPNLRVLFVDYNNFKFSTLPLGTGLSLYTYANQAQIEITPNDGVVDLSSEAVVNGVESTYRWFIGMPSYDDYGELVGEELYIDDEYTLENGVTTFLVDMDYIMCVIQNSQFPNLVLTTPFIDVTAGVEDIIADSFNSSVTVSGNTVTVNTAENANVRLYGTNGILYNSAKAANGTAQFSNLSSGVYIVTVGKKAAKIVVK